MTLGLTSDARGKGLGSCAVRPRGVGRASGLSAPFFKPQKVAFGLNRFNAQGSVSFEDELRDTCNDHSYSQQASHWLCSIAVRYFY